MRINLPYVVAVIGVSYVVMSDAQYSSTVVIEQTIIVTPSPSPSQNALSVLVSALQSPDWQPPEAMRVRSIGNSSSTVEIIAPTTLSIPLGNQTSVLTTTPTTESREGNASGITVHSSLETAQGTPTSARGTAGNPSSSQQSTQGSNASTGIREISRVFLCIVGFAVIVAVM